MPFLKWFTLFCLSFALPHFSFALTDSTASQRFANPIIFGTEKIFFTKIKQSELPAPFDFLLTQPLMTLGLEKYYQRNSQIKVIHAQKNSKENTYSRTILMVMDNNKKRNNVAIAQAAKQTIVVEFAFITINFNALPHAVIEGVLHSKTPFGRLLTLHKIKTTTSNRVYFKLPCTAQLAALMNCKLNNPLYGRLNTLNHAENGQWLARVMEILPAMRCTKTICQPA
ncbi:hypothetical protein [Legionella clemsonensis]|uniref:Uncharacterized protein n=1 Tax=Legionella clemsonensis TaxID=1867846 RepID=A0A222P633_9GAMM|nr:hypothetical protein [Legionella clemsonensis]ASQ47292.1 hypothetical protein clem_13825 [Legionella clemsonensis]